MKKSVFVFAVLLLAVVFSAAVSAGSASAQDQPEHKVYLPVVVRSNQGYVPSGSTRIYMAGQDYFADETGELLIRSSTTAGKFAVAEYITDFPGGNQHNRVVTVESTYDNLYALLDQYDGKLIFLYRLTSKFRMFVYEP